MKRLKVPRFSAEEERELASRARAGDREARELLILSCMPWAQRLAVRSHSHDEDLLQEVYLGLIHAVDTFDPDKGRLTTYSRWWVRQYIGKYWEREAGGVITIGRGVLRNGSRSEMMQERVNMLKRGQVSLERTVLQSGRAGRRRRLKDEIPDEWRAPNRLEDAEQQAEQDKLLNYLLSTLSQRERLIVTRVCDGETMVVIGRDLNISKERVRQIRDRAWAKLQRVRRRYENGES